MRITVLFTVLLSLIIGNTSAQTINQQNVDFREPTAMVKGFIENDSIKLEKIDYKQFKIYYKPGSYTSTHLDNIKADLDVAIDRIYSVLDIKNYYNGIYLLAVDSEDDMQKTVGMHIKGAAYQGQDFVVFVYNDKIRPQFKHEIFHLISYEEWGLSTSRLLNEGAATYCDNECFYDNPIYTINAYLLKKKMLYTLNDLVYNFDTVNAKNDVIAYLQSAGIVKYLYEGYGIDKLKTLWLQGFGKFESIYGFSLIQLEKDWKTKVSQTPIPKDFDWNKLNTHGCG